MIQQMVAFHNVRTMNHPPVFDWQLAFVIHIFALPIVLSYAVHLRRPIFYALHAYSPGIFFWWNLNGKHSRNDALQNQTKWNHTWIFFIWFRSSSISDRSFFSVAINWTLSRWSFDTPLYMSSNNFISFWSFNAFLKIPKKKENWLCKKLIPFQWFRQQRLTWVEFLSLEPFRIHWF